MAGTKSLAKDSVIYGGSSILVKMISWITTPLFAYNFNQPGDFGVMTNLYAYAALFMVILTFGLETGFFRFINQAPKEKQGSVYSTSLVIVGSIVSVFLLAFLYFLDDIRPLLWEDEIPGSYLRMLIILLCIDTLIALPFAFLRYEKKPLKFGFFKVLQAVIYVLLCVFFLIVCPWINKHHPNLIAWFWKENFCVGYVLISNLIATGIQALCLLPHLSRFQFSFDWTLAKKMLRYCFPLMLMGVAGMSNQVIDKIVFPIVYPDAGEAFDELGVYSACFKICVIMIMFTQAFRYAFDPYMFEKGKDKDAKQSYAVIMKYFVAIGLLVFLGVMFYIDIIKYFVKPTYFAALPIVPIVLMGELFFAVYYNLSLWYKLTDKTYWGTIFSSIGFVLIAALNIIFVPRYSYFACAWASLAGNLLIMLLSYFVGQKKYPIKYDLKAIGIYTALAALLFAVSYFVPIKNTYLHIVFNTFLLAAYIAFLFKNLSGLKNLLSLKIIHLFKKT
jgi:O-antigen/teichoic acid export membrane protein